MDQVEGIKSKGFEQQKSTEAKRSKDKDKAVDDENVNKKTIPRKPIRENTIKKERKSLDDSIKIDKQGRNAVRSTGKAQAIESLDDKRISIQSSDLQDADTAKASISKISRSCVTTATPNTDTHEKNVVADSTLEKSSAKYDLFD